jgi:Domain of unknown function (DUF4373)
MRWFQVDSDAPNDPKIRAVLERFGNAGFGALVRLWCFIASHGKQPGQSIDATGRKIPKQFLVDATGLSEPDFDDLLRELVRTNHVQKGKWRKNKIVEFPAMRRRADTYTKRVFEHSSNNVRVHTIPNNKTPLPPFTKGGLRVTRAQLKAAETRRNRVYGGCPHTPRCAKSADCVRELALEQLKVKA